jgi:opine dehydrogenase
MSRVSILGAGNGGCALAADLVRRGIDCTLFDLPSFAAGLDPIQASGTLRLSGVLGDVTVPAPPLTTDVREAVEDAAVLLVAVPAFAQVSFAEAIAPHLADDALVVLLPGSTGGALAVAEVFRRASVPGGVTVAEALSLPYACRKVEPTHVLVTGVKRDLPIAAFPASRNTRLADVLGDILPAGISLAGNVLETSLNSLNAMAHPVPALLNTGWIETTGGDFRFYTDGVSPSVARAMDTVDADRLAIVAALGLEAVPATEWDRRLYGLEGATTYELNRDSWVHRDIRAPGELRSRYLTEDVPYGLVPLASIGWELGVATPAIDLFIDLACLLLDEDLRAGGRTAASLGLAGRSAGEMIEYVDAERA